MRNNLSDDFIAITARLMLARERSEIVRIAADLNTTIEKLIASENEGSGTKHKTKSVTTTITFKKEEVVTMAKSFKKEFIANGLVAHITKRESGKHTYCYEIRYRSNGYNISASSTDLAEAKRKFLEKTRPENIDKYQVRFIPSGSELFRDIAMEWLAYKKGKISDPTIKTYASYCKRIIFPALGHKPIFAIRTIDVDKVLKDRTPRVYEDLRIVFNSVFTYAIKSGLISHNPVALVPFKKAERTPRSALTKEEQRLLLDRLNLPEFSAYKQSFFLQLYCGLRPCELNDARFEGNFLVARNAKRKGGKIEYKKIPIPKQAREKLDLTVPIVNRHDTATLGKIFKRIMSGQEITQYSLRHTFATTCQIYVRPDIVDIWMGDSSERLVGKVYTHFPDEFMIEQMEKVLFDI